MEKHNIYYLISKANGKCLEVDPSDNKNGARLLLGEFQKKNCQKWEIIKSSDDGVISVANKQVKKFLDNGCHRKDKKLIHLWEKLDELQQKWKLISDDDGFYFLQSQYSGKCLTLYNHKNESLEVVQSEKDNGDNQRWGLVPVESLTLSLKFTIFEIEIFHKHLNDIGKFAVFCLKAIREGATLEDIADIIQIDKEIIKKQLSFIISRKYLNDDCQLLEQGKQILAIYDFMEQNNQNKPLIALEHYIENPNDKNIFLFKTRESLSSIFEEYSDSPLGIELNQPIWDYKVENKFYEIIENSNEKAVTILKEMYPEKCELIEGIKDELEFEIKLHDDVKNEKRLKSFYLNRILEIEEFYEILTDEQSENKLLLPCLNFNSSFSIAIPDQQLESALQEWLEYNSIKSERLFNLLNGKEMESDQNNKESREKGTTTYIEPIFDAKDIFDNRNKVDIPTRLFNFVNIKTIVKRGQIVKYLSNQSINNLIVSNYGNNRDF